MKTIQLGNSRRSFVAQVFFFLGYGGGGSGEKRQKAPISAAWLVARRSALMYTRHSADTLSTVLCESGRDISSVRVIVLVTAPVIALGKNH